MLMRQCVSPPSWKVLLATGAKYLITTPVAWAYVVAYVAAIVLLGELVERGSLLELGLLAVQTYWVFLIVRHAMTGRWEIQRRDLGAFCRFVGAMLVLGIGALIVATPLVLLFGFWDNLGPATQALGAVLLFGLIARICFYLPALALGDETSLDVAASQSSPHWRRLLPLLVVVWGVPEVLFALAMTQPESSLGLWPIALGLVALRPIGDVIGWVAVSRLYIWFSPRAAATQVPS
jgi:hypothetical protein